MKHDRALHCRITRRRRHLEAMQLALAEGLTLDEAQARIDAYYDHRSRLEAPGAGAPDTAEADRPLQWWLES